MWLFDIKKKHKKYGLSVCTFKSVEPKNAYNYNS